MKFLPLSSRQDVVNQRVYHTPGVERSYYSAELSCAEAAALLKYQKALAGRDVLDLGVGTGRTTRYLAPLARQYACIDYSPHMVAHVRAHMQDIAVRLGDMRDLSAFEPASIDFVVASCNLIDAVSHADRAKVFDEVHRVLRPDGVFYFSTHNLDFSTALHGPHLQLSRNPGKQVLHLLRFVRQVVNHRRTGKLRHIENNYALLDDPGHDYQLLHYYINRQVQEDQLAQHGFATLDVFSESGHALKPGETDLSSSSLHYVARRLNR